MTSVRTGAMIRQALAVMMALALASIHAGQAQRMRSLVEPVALADTG